MQRTWTTGLASGLAGGLLLLAVGQALHAQNTPAAPAATGRVACADIVKIFSEYDRQKDFINEIKTAQEKLQAEDQTRRAELDKIQADIGKLSPEDPTYRPRMKDLQAKSIDYKNWSDIKQAAMNREIGVWSAQFYQEITNAAKMVAQQQGYDAVFYKDEFEVPANLDPQAIREQIRGRKLIYVNPAVDLTQAILDRLNTEHRAKPKQPMLDLN